MANTDDEGIPANRAMTAILALLIADRQEDEDSVKTEVVLSNGGLDAPEIAQLMGKKVDAVRKTLQRARKGK